MKAVYRRELKSLFCNLTGELFMALMLCITGIYCAVMGFSGGYTSFEIVLSNTEYLFLILIPLLTMRTFAEERRQGTEKLLYSLPLRTTEIVLGKYFAVVTVIAGVYLLFCGYPLLFSAYGTVDFAIAYGAIFGSFLTGCALAAVGIFCSATAENPVLAAVFSFGLSFLGYMAPKISSYISSSGFAAFVLFTFAIVLLIVLLRFLTKKLWIPITVGFCLELPLIVVLLLDYTLLEGAVQSVLNVIALFSRLDTFVYGVIDGEAVLYLVSVSFLFLLFTVLRMERHPRGGWYHTALCALAILSVVAANVLVGALPASLTKLDTTREGVFSLSESSKSFLRDMEDDVTVYLLAGTGEEDEGITELIDRIQSCTDKVHLETRDPILYPLFADEYTTLDLSENSLIIVSAHRSTTVEYGEIYVYDSDSNLIFDGESTIINALHYVTTDSLPVVYTLSGHGEAEISEDLVSILNTDGFAVRSLEMRTASGIPGDAALIAILSPTADLTEQETAVLTDYLNAGGGVLICEDMLAVSTPNLDALLETCGMQAQKGLIVEGDTDYYLNGYPTYLLPAFSEHTITELYSEMNYRTVLPVTQSVTTTAEPVDHVTVTTILHTSDSAYRKEDPLTVTTLDFETGDILGRYAVAAVSENSATGGKLAWFGTSLFLEASINELTSGANHGVFASSCLWLSNQETGLSIPAKSLALQVMVMSEEQALFWNAICVYVIPIVIALAGVFVMVYRRKRAGRKGKR